MFLKRFALYLVFLFTWPPHAQAKGAEDGLYLTGVSIWLLVFQHNAFGAEAAWSKLKKQFKRLRVRDGAEGEDPEGEEMIPVESEVTIPKNVRKLFKDLISVYAYGLTLQDNSHFRKPLGILGAHTNEAGEAAVRRALEWRAPPPKSEGPLDVAFPVGGVLDTISCYCASGERLTRIRGPNTTMQYWTVSSPTLGEVSLRRIEIPEDAISIPSIAETPFMETLHQVYIPSPLGGGSPAKVALEYGLVTVLDIFKLQGTYVAPGLKVPGKVVFNVFVAHPSIECTLPELLRELEVRSSQEHLKAAVRHARLSLSLQLLKVLGNLRNIGLSYPSINAEGFVLNHAGRLLFKDYAPLLRDDKRYMKFSDGEIVDAAHTKKLKTKHGVPEPVILDPYTPNVDAVKLLHVIWCGLNSREQISEEDSSSPAGPSTSVDLPEGATGGVAEGAVAPVPTLTAKDFECGDVPHALLHVIEELLNPNGLGLAKIVSAPAFRKLSRLALSS